MQSNAIGKALKNSVYFSIGIVLCKATSLLLLPLYTRFLTDAEYGMASTIVSFVSTFGIVVMLSLRSAIIRFYAEKQAENQMRVLVGTVTLFVLLNGTAVTVLLVLFKNTITATLLEGIPFYPLGFMGVLALFFDTVYLTYQSVLQAGQNGWGYSKNSILYMLINVIMNILFLVVFEMRAMGMVLALLLTNFCFAVFGIIDMYRKKLLIFAFDRPMLRESLRYSLPIVPHDMANTLSAYASKLLLGSIVSYGATGLYSVAAQISTVMSLVQNAINLAFHPWFNEQMRCGEEGRKNIRHFSLITFTAYGYVCILISLFCKELMYFFTAPAYHEAWRIVPILCFSMMLSFVYYTHALTIFYNVKKSKFISVCSISGCAANIAFIYFLTPTLGIYGTALAGLLAKIVLATIAVLYSRHVQPVDFGLKSMLIEAIAAALIICAGLYMDYSQIQTTINWQSILIKGIVALVLTLFVFLKYRNMILFYLRKTIKHHQR